MLFRSLVLVLVCLCGVLSFGPTRLLDAQEPARWKFSAGQTLLYEVTQQAIIRTEAGEAGAFTADARQTLNLAWQIDSVDDRGAASGVQTIERIRVEIVMPSGLELQYDSDSEESPTGIAAMLAPMYEALLEAEIPLTIEPTGELTRFAPPEELTDRLAAVPATRPMSDLITGAGLRQPTEQVAILLPGTEEPATREVAINNRVLGTLGGELTWSPTDDEPDADAAVFRPRLTVTIEPQAADDETEESSPPPRIISPKLETQEVSGQAVFDRSAGRLTRSELVMQLEISGELMGMPITCEVQQRTDVVHQSE